MGIFKQIRDAAAGDMAEGDPPADTQAPAVNPPSSASVEVTEGAAVVPGGPGEPAVGVFDEGGDPEAPDSGTSATKGVRVTRRGFLGGTAALAGTAAITYFATGPASLAPRPRGTRPSHPSRTGAHVEEVVPGSPPLDPSYDFKISVERDTDLCVIDFFFYNFEVGTSPFGGPAIVPTDTPNYVIIRFPPQHIAEGVYPSPSSSPDPTGLFCDPQPILSALSGPSQLSYSFGMDGWISLPTMTAADLLDWSGWSLNVPVVAQVPQATVFVPGTGQYAYYTAVPPGSFDTYIEFPYALFLAPSYYNQSGVGYDPEGFNTDVSNQLQPLTSSAGISDLFTSRVTQTPFHLNESNPQVGMCAIWAAGMPGPYSTNNETTDMTPEIVIFYGAQPT